MKTVRIAELKARLSKHLRAVRAGDEVVVLDRETPVARIVPYRDEEQVRLEFREPPRNPEGLARLRFRRLHRRKIDTVSVLLADRRRR